MVVSLFRFVETELIADGNGVTERCVCDLSVACAIAFPLFIALSDGNEWFDGNDDRVSLIGE